MLNCRAAPAGMPVPAGGSRKRATRCGMRLLESIRQPPPEPVRRRRRPAWMRSDAVIPGSVPAEVVLIRTEQVAVAVGSVRPYPNGFEITVHTRLRGDDENWGPGAAAPFEGHRHRRGPLVPEEALRLGVMSADGRLAATTGRQPLSHAAAQTV